MPLPDLTGQNIENTYQRLVQTDGTNFYDGTGSIVNLGGETFPYTGSAIITGSLILTGSAYISGGVTTQYIDFDINATPPFQEGRIQWIDDTKTLNIDTDVSGFSIEVGHQTVIRGRNETGFDFPTGTVVYIIGGNNSRPLFSTASWENDAGSAYTIGIVAQPINNNNNGYAITNGILRGINTSLFTAGDALYLSSSGQITNISPVAPRHNVRLGKVISATNNGLIHVDIDNGYELGELHDVRDTTTSTTYGALLVKSGSIWKDSYQLTGSYGLTGSLTATSLTSSLFGTASWAANALTASFAPNYVATRNTSSMLAPYVLNSQTSSFAKLAADNQFSGENQFNNITSFASNIALAANVTLDNDLTYSLGGDPIRDYWFATASIGHIRTFENTIEFYDSVSRLPKAALKIQNQNFILEKSDGTKTSISGSNADFTGNVRASFFFGNGSNLTGINTGSWNGVFTGSAVISGSLILTGSFKALLPTSSNDTYFLTYNTASYQLEAREVATLINPKVEYYDVTASISSGTSITLPNGLSYLSSSTYEYLEVFFNGLRLRYNRDFIPTSITTIQTQIAFPSGSELTFKSLKA
jgi:hypothetical protein